MSDYPEDYAYDAAALMLEQEHRQIDEFLTAHYGHHTGVRVINVNDVFPSNYLKASDLQGHTVKVVITSVTIEEIGSDRKPVIKFQGKDKGLALNKTNAQIIAGKYSPETNGWIGKEIELRPDKTQFNGQLVDCIRVQIPAPPAPLGGSGSVPF